MIGKVPKYRVRCGAAAPLVEAPLAVTPRRTFRVAHTSRGHPGAARAIGRSLVPLLLLCLIPACSMPQPGSTPALESAKLQEMRDSPLAHGAFDRADGPIEETPGFTDDLGSAFVNLTQPLGGRDATAAFARALRNSQRQGVTFTSLYCLKDTFSAGGFAKTASRTATSGFWPTGVTLGGPRLAPGQPPGFQLSLDVSGGTILTYPTAFPRPSPKGCPLALVKAISGGQ